MNVPARAPSLAVPSSRDERDARETSSGAPFASSSLKRAHGRAKETTRRSPHRASRRVIVMSRRARCGRARARAGEGRSEARPPTNECTSTSERVHYTNEW